MSGPLEGIRVVELAGIGPGPFAATLLAELGASVVRIDRPAPGGLQLPSGLGRSRPSVAVDLRSPGGIELVLRIAEGADVLLEGMRPGVIERLGLGPDVLLDRNPRLVLARMTGWGQTGPLAHTAGHDITYAAISGVLSLGGGRGKPAPPANLLADFGGGTMYCVVGILAALLARARTGEGQVVDAAMVDGAASLSTMLHGMRAAGLWNRPRGYNLLDGGLPHYDTYECADGRYVAVGPLEPQFSAQLIEILGVDVAGDIDDPATHPAYRAAFEEVFRTRTRDEWAARFAQTDACVAPVLDLDEAPRHPHLVARGVFAEVAGSPAPRVAPRFSRTPALDPTPERPPGADSREWLCANGFSADEVDRLIADGVVVQARDVTDASAGPAR